MTIYDAPYRKNPARPFSPFSGLRLCSPANLLPGGRDALPNEFVNDHHSRAGVANHRVYSSMTITPGRSWSTTALIRLTSSLPAIVTDYRTHSPMTITPGRARGARAYADFQGQLMEQRVLHELRHVSAARCAAPDDELE